MACKTSTQLHHHFPKIADEAGFTFNTHRPRLRIDWNKIRVIDVENLIRERKFNLIEQHLNDILDCILESEFDVRILDEGVLKMFRLAQLTVEYQQFCRHYLDRSVYVLREEINSLAQELDVTKKELKDRDEEIRKLKRKTKHTYRTPLPYGNDNIANMILKTLSNKSEFFPTSTTGDAIQYNKCVYCDKVFMNQLYLKSHISRRHSNIMDTPQKDVDDNAKVAPTNIENNKLSYEVLELKQKLKEMEDVIKNVNVTKQESPKRTNHNNISTEQPTNISITKEMKDAEVSTNNEINLLDRIEEWKKEEHDKYNKEINLLRSQIMETIQSLKEKDSSTALSTDKDLKVIEHLNTTISKQGSEILTLKQELMESKLKIEKEENERRKENETQMLQWAKRTEDHAKQYETLLQKLNDVAREARESSAQAEQERERVAQLEDILQKNLSERHGHDTVKSDTKNPSGSNKKDVVKQTPIKRKSFEKPSPEASRQTLERLHQKAQALLNIRSSSSSSDMSSVENPIPKQQKPSLKKQQSINIRNHTNKELKKEETNVVTITKKEKVSNHVLNKNNTLKHNGKEQKSKRDKSIVKKSIKIEKNGPIHIPGSPIKVLRAKITEEVNNRLISNGVDPLKSGLPKANYQKQRVQLQQQVEFKSKKNPSHEKVRYSILAYLDSSIPKKATLPQQDYVSPSKTSKPFSFTSVISNVKSKALSFVKSNDANSRDNRKSLNAEVAKRALKLLNTPPDSTHSSPVSQKHNFIVAQPKLNLNMEPKRNRPTPKKAPEITISEKSKRPMINSSPHTTDDSEDDTESDHKYYKANVQETSKLSIDNLIKSPARRPLSANNNYNNGVHKYVAKDDHLLRSQSATNITHVKPDTVINSNLSKDYNRDSSNTESSEHILIEEIPAKGNPNSPKQTKSVLKNASSTSSLNKKKVIFDMDAIQMKSLSASPSQSITEKSDGNEKYELGLINLDGEEWDISSIENEPLKNDTKLKVSTRTSPKIAELKHTIESQLARRNETPSSAIVGGVDLLAGPMLRASSVGGSNTSLGSSILDDSETMPPIVNHNSFVKPKTIAHKDDSELDLSEFSTDGLFTRKKENDSF